MYSSPDPNQQYNYGGGYPPQGGYGGYPPQGPPQGYPPYAQGGAQPYPQGPYGQPYGQGPPPGGYAPQPGFIQPPPSAGGYGAYDDPESQPKNFSFDDQSIRRGFIRKVYLILMVSG